MSSLRYSVIDQGRALLARLLPSARALRLAAYSACVALGISCFAARALYAQTRESAFAFGQELVGLADLTAGAETVLLNGERFHHALVVSPEPLDSVLDRLVQHCESRPGLAGRAISELAQRQSPSHAPPGPLGHAIFREQDGTRGMVLCFVAADGKAAQIGWLSALRRFNQTHDLSEFGRLRYSFAETTAEHQTRVVTLWADTGLNLRTLFPAAGDAAGADSAVLPRPPSARRTLAASAPGTAFSVHAYRSQQSVAEAQKFYDAWLSARGWQSAHLSELGASRYLRPDGYQAFISISRESDHTDITVTEAGQAEASSIASVELESAP